LRDVVLECTCVVSKSLFRFDSAMASASASMRFLLARDAGALGFRHAGRRIPPAASPAGVPRS
jgi:hypothetical protein